MIKTVSERVLLRAKVRFFIEVELNGICGANYRFSKRRIRPINKSSSYCVWT